MCLFKSVTLNLIKNLSVALVLKHLGIGFFFFVLFSNNAVMDPKENDSVKSKMSHSKVFCKKEIVKYFVKHTGKILCRSPYFIELLVFSQQFIKKETPAQTICLKIWKKINNKSFTELELQMNSSGRAIHFSKSESNSYCQYF